MKQAFSLMEMMIVLLIVAIIAAATAPMVTKKMARSAGGNDSPFVFTNLAGSAAFNLKGGDQSLIIGAPRYKTKTGNDPTHPRLVLAAGNANQPAFVFANSNGVYEGQLSQNDNITTWLGKSSGTPDTNSLAIGTNQTISTVQGVTALGDTVTVSGQNATAVGYNTSAEGTGSIAIGNSAAAVHDSSITDMTQSNNSNHAIAIGTSAKACKWGAIAIGPKMGEKETLAARGGSVAIGASARANAHSSVAIGEGAVSSSDHNTEGGTTAVGPYSETTNRFSTAIGYKASAKGKNSTAIGAEAVADKDEQITLGTRNSVVYIPGKLVVDQRTILGRRNGITYIRAGKDEKDKTYSHLMAMQTNGNNQGWKFGNFDNYSNNVEIYSVIHNGITDIGNDYDTGTANINTNYIKTISNADEAEKKYEGGLFKYRGPYPKGDVISSDRRLKNVGEKYTAGLAELKKLDFFHYTFKNDETKTPHVGVIAQDLQKVFPDSVTKGGDGYLRIRWDEMFYAVLNAVKELDARISAIAENVKANFDKIAKLEATVSEQQKTIEELKSQNEIYEKQLELLDKRLNKLEKRGK